MSKVKKTKQIMSVWQFMARFPNEKTARRHVERLRWGDKVTCPKCGSQAVSNVKNETPQPYRCRDCRKFFSVKTDTVFQGSNLSLQKCLYAIYLINTNKKGISSCELARELGITQKSAWYLAQRIRETFRQDTHAMLNEVEIDETYIGGIEKNKHEKKKLRAGRGGIGKQAVVGIRERKTGRMKVERIDSTNRNALQSNIKANVAYGATVYTDGHKSYKNINGYNHEAVAHNVGEYVRGLAHTNGVESFWALLKRGYYGVFHHFSKKHMHRYINEFVVRHNRRKWNTQLTMDECIRQSIGNILGYRRLVNG